MLVLAGPGSGKTTVISERVRYLIEEKGVEPGRILTITFTKAAALEMQSRCQKICPRAANAVFGTFHSVFYQILRKSETYQNFSVITEKEKMNIMKKIISSGNMTCIQHEYLCETMLKKISYYKNSQISDVEDSEFISAMNRYTNLCYENSKLDFDDMLVLCRKLLSENKSERVKWQNRFDYLLIDEFQDINACQYEIVKLLSEKHGNIFVVGDDDQAIYSFRGSNPVFMKEFLRDFANSRQVCLEDNYRSGTEIVTLAGKCIRANENRFEKNICARASCENDVKIIRYDDVIQEINAIAEQIEQSISSDAAILLRTNMQAEFAAEILSKHGIKCVFREKRSCFYENEWVQDILAVLRFVFCGQKRKDFFVFMNKPFRGIERVNFLSETVDFDEVKKQIEDIKEVEKIERSVKIMRGLDTYGAVMYALNGLKYRSYMNEMSGSNKKIKEQMDLILQELFERIREYDSVPEFLDYVKQYRENFEREKSQSTEEGVKVLTYHAAKGLEFNSVYLPMLNNGKVPHGRMLTTQQTEEERRMFYVAMTRAKRHLVLSWHGTEDKMQKSLFLQELDLKKQGAEGTIKKMN